MNSLSASLCRTFWWTMQQTWSLFLWRSIPGPQMRLTASSVCLSLRWLWPGQLPCDLVCPRLVNTSKQVMLSKATSFYLNGFSFCQRCSKNTCCLFHLLPFLKCSQPSPGLCFWHFHSGSAFSTTTIHLPSRLSPRVHPQTRPLSLGLSQLTCVALVSTCPVF